MPPTALLLVKYGMVTGEFPSYTAVAYHYGITITDQGVIWFNGKEQLPKYILDTSPNVEQFDNGFSKEDAIANWAKNHMKLPSGHRLYRYLL